MLGGLIGWIICAWTVWGWSSKSNKDVWLTYAVNDWRGGVLGVWAFDRLDGTSQVGCGYEIDHSSPGLDSFFTGSWNGFLNSLVVSSLRGTGDDYSFTTDSILVFPLYLFNDPYIL